MKTLSLVISRILNDFSKSKAMMIMYAIGSILCVLVFIYFYNNIQILLKDYEEFVTDYINRQYLVGISPSEIQKSDVEFLYNYNEVENINLVVRYEVQNGEYTVINSKDYNEDELVNFDVLNTYSSVEYIQKEILHGEENDELLKFAEENMNNNVIFTNSKEETITINGIPFKNIYIDTVSCGYIPINAVFNNNFPTDFITILFYQYPNVFFNAEFGNVLREHFGKYGILFLSTANSGSIDYLYNVLLFEILRLCLMYVIGFAGCAVLFKYMFDLNRYENIVYSIVGSSKLKVTKIIFLEATVMSVISIIIAIILHISLYDCFFSLINRQEIAYTFGDYCIIALFSLILSLLTLIPFFIPYMKNPIMKSKTRYE